MQSVACNASHTLFQRCARWLLKCHDRVDGDELRLTQQFLAEMLVVSRVAVNAELKDFSNCRSSHTAVASSRYWTGDFWSAHPANAIARSGGNTTDCCLVLSQNKMPAYVNWLAIRSLITSVHKKVTSPKREECTRCRDTFFLRRISRGRRSMVPIKRTAR